MAKTKWTDPWRIWAGVFPVINLFTMARVLLSNCGAIPTVRMVRAARTGLSDFITRNGKIEPVSAHIIMFQF